MERIAATFERLRAQSRKALISSVTAGYPHADITPALMHVLVEAGADIIELGMPSSVLPARGASLHALSPHSAGNGGPARPQAAGLQQLLEQVAQFRLSDSSTSVVLSGTAQSIEGGGGLRHPVAFAESAAVAGLDGVLAFDPSPALSHALARPLRRCGLDWIASLAPTVTDDDIRQLAACTSGYVHGRFFPDGIDAQPAGQARDCIWRIRRHIAIPLGLAAGIGDMHTARRAASMADALIVGPWLAARLADKPAAAALAAASDLFRELRGQLDQDIPSVPRISKHAPFRR
ncbi:hypothetical protein CBF45_14825 [Bordetella sp. J329]|nr:hypothetical protein CBF45_14825 [Bordetella sp. J329]